MTKRDILNKIKNAILGEGSTTPGITVTNKTQKEAKKFNDEYYKESNKKFKDYLGIKKDDFDAPKVNADEKQEKTYGGSGMEGLTYDNEGTEVAKKFKKRNDDLNKPSKDYYLKKDEVNDVYSKLNKKSQDYKKDKQKFQNTKPVREIKAENTMKRLTYKQEFINENSTLQLIPEEFKKNDLVFEMTDGNKLLKVRWEGGVNGKGVILLSKDDNRINEELTRMKQLFEYNSRETFGKSDIISENEELHNMVSKFRGKDEQAPVSTAPTSTDTPNQSAVRSATSRPLQEPIIYKDGRWEIFNKMSMDDFKNKVISIIQSIPGYEPGSTKQVSGQPITTLRTLMKNPALTPEQKSFINTLNLDQVRSTKTN